MVDLPWDPNEWSWRAVDGLDIAPLFGYSTKRSYKRNKTHYMET